MNTTTGISSISNPAAVDIISNPSAVDFRLYEQLVHEQSINAAMAFARAIDEWTDIEINLSSARGVGNYSFNPGYMVARSNMDRAMQLSDLFRTCSEQIRDGKLKTCKSISEYLHGKIDASVSLIPGLRAVITAHMDADTTMVDPPAPVNEDTEMNDATALPSSTSNQGDTEMRDAPKRSTSIDSLRRKQKAEADREIRSGTQTPNSTASSDSEASGYIHSQKSSPPPGLTSLV